MCHSPILIGHRELQIIVVPSDSEEPAFRQGTASAVPYKRRRSAALAAEGMAVPRRHAKIAGTYFVTSRTWESRRLFITEPMCLLFVETLLRYRQQGAYALHAFVLMPDHFHILLSPSVATALERAVQLIKGGSAHALGVERHLQFPVWQRGFSDHRIRDAGDYVSHVPYIEQNPLRKRLVVGVMDYRWSSASSKYNMDPVPQGLKPEEKAKTARHG
jgi:putative transposase